MESGSFLYIAAEDANPKKENDLFRLGEFWNRLKKRPSPLLNFVDRVKNFLRDPAGKNDKNPCWEAVAPQALSLVANSASFAITSKLSSLAFRSNWDCTSFLAFVSGGEQQNPYFILSAYLSPTFLSFGVLAASAFIGTRAAYKLAKQEILYGSDEGRKAWRKTKNLIRASAVSSFGTALFFLDNINLSSVKEPGTSIVLGLANHAHEALSVDLDAATNVAIGIFCLGTTLWSLSQTKAVLKNFSPTRPDASGLSAQNSELRKN